MKSKVIHLDPVLQQAAEAVLRKDESVSEFVETSLRENIAHRLAQKEFFARGIAGRDEARRTGKYLGAPEVLAKLDAILLAKQNGRRSD
jgi:hypothetical protein